MNMRASLFPVRSVHDAINREGKPNKTKWLKILVRGSESEQTYEPKVELISKLKFPSSGMQQH